LAKPRHSTPPDPIARPQVRGARRSADVPSRPQKRSLVPAILFAVGLTFGLGYFLTWYAPGGIDRVSGPELDARAKALEKAGPLSLPVVKAEELDAALASMKLPPAARAALVAELQARRTQIAAAAPLSAAAVPASAGAQDLPLVWITLWDTHREDGDIVSVTSGGYVQQVTLTNATLRFAVPIPRSGAISLAGVHDGGGGITVGAMSGETRVPLPIMRRGQVLEIPVVAR